MLFIDSRAAIESTLRKYPKPGFIGVFHVFGREKCVESESAQFLWGSRWIR